jgi:hypothetical protein
MQPALRVARRAGAAGSDPKAVLIALSGEFAVPLNVFGLPVIDVG